MGAPIDDLIDRDLLDLLHSKVASDLIVARNTVDSWQEHAETLEAKLARIEERMIALQPGNAASPILTPAGRVKKGLSKPLILDFVKASNGVGVTMKQIIAGTQTKYGTIRRVLQDSPDVEQTPEGRWRWKQPNNLSTQQSNGSGATSSGKATLRLVEC